MAHDQFSIDVSIHQFGCGPPFCTIKMCACVYMYDVHMYALSWVNRQEMKGINKTDPSIL